MSTLPARRRRPPMDKERAARNREAARERSDERRRRKREAQYGERGAAVRAMPCLALHSGGCRGAIHAAHVGAGGMGMKASRRELVPLCWWHHIEELHRRGEKTFQQEHEIDLRLAAQLVAGELDKLGLA